MMRLHSAIGCVTPKDKLEGRDKEIFSERDHKSHRGREQRKAKRLERQGKEASQSESLLTAQARCTNMQTPDEARAGSARRCDSVFGTLATGEQPARDNRLGSDGTSKRRRRPTAAPVPER